MPAVKWFVEHFRTVAQKTGSIRELKFPWPADCLLCLDAVRGAMVCDNCERLLPNSRRRCPRCALPMSEDWWCADCLREPPAFDDVVTAFDYRFPIDRLVRRFKFSADLATGAYLGDALARAAATAPMPDLVLASPASAARLRERGFNPALVLARRVASAAGIAVDSRVVAKIRHTPPQTGLDHATRRRNLRGAFAVRRRLDGIHVAVVDDVMTTGTTLSALAAVLKAAGAARVSGWVAARTPEPPRED
ncbi:MAG TPA: ComF family protein [Usitatibacteraceae bacterium]|nr:ComF family protein [Usitatibacteraceae bacterium]